MKENKEIKKNENKLLYTMIGIIVILAIIIIINTVFYSKEVMISLIDYKKIWMTKHLSINFALSTVLTLIYSYIIFNKKDFEKIEKWKSIICIGLLIIIPAVISYILLENNTIVYYFAN